MNYCRNQLVRLLCNADQVYHYGKFCAISWRYPYNFVENAARKSQFWFFSLTKLRKFEIPHQQTTWRSSLRWNGSCHLVNNNQFELMSWSSVYMSWFIRNRGLAQLIWVRGMKFSCVQWFQNFRSQGWVNLSCNNLVKLIELVSVKLVPTVERTIGKSSSGVWLQWSTS